jgi:hypothetical protein
MTRPIVVAEIARRRTLVGEIEMAVIVVSPVALGTFAGGVDRLLVPFYFHVERQSAESTRR